MTYHVLKNNSLVLQTLLGKLSDLDRLNFLFKSVLDQELAGNCQVVKFDRNCLFVLVSSGSWLTQLRFLIPDLMVQLKVISPFENLSGIICKTRPRPAIASRKLKSRFVARLSPTAAKQMSDIAESLKDLKLKKILKSIASRCRD